jgi:CcmD family protein
MDQVPNTIPELFWGYTALWAILAVYILSLGARLARLEKKSDESCIKKNDDAVSSRPS